MDPRGLIAVVVGLVLLAFGGFYFALGLHSKDPLVPPAPTATASGAAAPSAPSAPPSRPTPAMATSSSIETEIAQSEHAELQALLKRNFNPEYNELIAVAVRRRNEGVSDSVFGQELNERFQEIMRGKLKHGAGASMPAIDRLAANEASLFRVLGTEGSSLCLKMLGKDDAPAATTPESVRQLMRLGTLYRFQAIVEGQANAKPSEVLTTDEMRAFEASVSREGLNFTDVSTGVFLDKAGIEPGKPCLALQTLHLAIARLPEGTRRKIYAGMFFLERDK
jgi:hypothetical protein